MFMGEGTLNIIEGRQYPIYQEGNLEGGASSPSLITAWEEIIPSNLFQSH